MKIYNKTTYNFELSMLYNRYFLFQFLLTRFSVLFLIVVGASIYFYLINMTKYILPIFGILAFNLLLLLTVNYVNLIKNKRKKALNEPAYMEYEFHEHSFLVSKNDASEDKEVSYNELRKVKKTTHFILGYFNKSTIPMILSREGFLNEEDFTSLYNYLILFIKKGLF